MGNKDFIKPILERKGTVHFGKVMHNPRANSYLWPAILKTIQIPVLMSIVLPVICHFMLAFAICLSHIGHA